MSLQKKKRFRDSKALAKTFSTLSSRDELLRYMKFNAGGAFSMLINLFCTYLLTEYMRLWYMLSYALSLGVETLFLFVYHTRFTFQKQGQFLRFVGVLTFINILNWLTVLGLSVFFCIRYLFSIIFAASTISVLNYRLNQKVVFPQETQPQEKSNL